MAFEKTWTDEDMATFRSMWDAGRSVSDIAKALGRSEGAIKRSRVRFGLEARRNNATKTIRVRVSPEFEKSFRDACKKKRIPQARAMRDALDAWLTATTV